MSHHKTLPLPGSSQTKPGFEFQCCDCQRIEHNPSPILPIGWDLIERDCTGQQCVRCPDCNEAIEQAHRHAASAARGKSNFHNLFLRAPGSSTAGVIEAIALIIKYLDRQRLVQNRQLQDSAVLCLISETGAIADLLNAPRP